MYLKYKKTQIYTPGSVGACQILNIFCLLMRPKLFPGCYQWKRNQIMCRLPEELKTFKKQLEKVSSKGLQRINLKRFHSSQVCLFTVRYYRLAINRCTVEAAAFQDTWISLATYLGGESIPFCTKLPFSSLSQPVKNKSQKKHTANLLEPPYAHTQKYRHIYMPFLLDFHSIHWISCCTF